MQPHRTDPTGREDAPYAADIAQVTVTVLNDRGVSPLREDPLNTEDALVDLPGYSTEGTGVLRCRGIRDAIVFEDARGRRQLLVCEADPQPVPPRAGFVAGIADPRIPEIRKRTLRGLLAEQREEQGFADRRARPAAGGGCRRADRSLRPGARGVTG